MQRQALSQVSGRLSRENRRLVLKLFSSKIQDFQMDTGRTFQKIRDENWLLKIVSGYHERHIRKNHGRAIPAK